MSRASLPTHAAMAAEPVSPDVATTMVARWLRPAGSWSKRRPHHGVDSAGVWIRARGRGGVERDGALHVRPHYVEGCGVVRTHFRRRGGAEAGPPVALSQAGARRKSGEQHIVGP